MKRVKKSQDTREIQDGHTNLRGPHTQCMLYAQIGAFGCHGRNLRWTALDDTTIAVNVKPDAENQDWEARMLS